MRHLDLFSGIGGFALAVESVWPDAVHTFCDIEPFSQAILRKHWPAAKIYDDIKTLKGSEVGPIDLITGGFPCQPFSAAGKRRGKEDDRHLWPHMLRVIRETSPRWVIGENVGGLLTWNGGMVLDEVYADLEVAGYEVWAFVIPACAVNAPHRRDRVWIIAHSDSGANGRTARGHEGEGERIFKRHKVGKSSKSSEVRDVKDSRCLSTRDSKRRGDEKRSSNKSARSDKDVTYADIGRVRRHERQGAQKGPASCGSWAEDWPEVAAKLCTLDDGLPDGSPRPKGWRNAALKGAGNAIVPQVAEMILRHISLIDNIL